MRPHELVSIASMLPIAFVLAFTAGCSPTPYPARPEQMAVAQTFDPPPAGSGRVYVFRSGRPIMACTGLMDDVDIVLGTDSFAVWEVDAGVHTFTMYCGYDNYGLQLTIEDGGLYFVDATFSSTNNLVMASEYYGRRAVGARKSMAINKRQYYTR